MSDVIIACRDDTRAGTVAAHLRERRHTAVVTTTGRECLARFEAQGAEVVLVMLPLGDVAPDDLLRHLRDADRNVHIIVSGIEEPVLGPYDAFAHGAMEYLEAPSREPEALLSAVGVATGSRQGDLHLRYLREQSAAQVHGGLVTESAPMREVSRMVRQLCLRTGASTAPGVLITGETGTGKGMLARFIHFRGGRRSGPFVEVNCAAMPAALLESELFGHERGAFTDAKSQRLGLFETAHRGTLFLDEIGSAPLAVQAKLLKAIEDKRVRRVGGTVDVDVDVQVIAATHHNLRHEVRRGRFRADLYHRLNVVALRVPALRDRGPDKVRLAEQFVTEICRNYGMPPKELGASARRFIEQYTWPGNVRELRNQLERILLLQEGPLIEVAHFDTSRSNAPPASSHPPASASPTPIPEPVSWEPENTAPRSGTQPPRGEDAQPPRTQPPRTQPPRTQPPRTQPPRTQPSRKDSGLVLRIPDEGMALDDIEKTVIAHALERFDGNVSQAARHLHVTRQTLIYRMRKHDLSVERKVKRAKR